MEEEGQLGEAGGRGGEEEEEEEEEVEKRHRRKKKKKKPRASLAPNTMHIFKRAKVKRYNFTQ